MLTSYDSWMFISYRLLASAIFITFGDEIVEEFENFVTYKLQNFVSDVGGLLGLFLGCSLLSIMEVFFLIISFFCNSIKGSNKAASENEKSMTDDCKNDNLEVRMGRLERQVFEVKNYLKKLEVSEKNDLRVEDL